MINSCIIAWSTNFIHDQQPIIGWSTYFIHDQQCHLRQSNHPPSSLARGRRATEQKSESECIDAVCIVHGFMNNIIHNSSCMINIDHWMKDCWSCKINIDHCHERLSIIYHNCWSLYERLLIMYDKHWSLPWKPVDHVSQLLIMYRIVITNTNTAGVKFSGTQQMLYILKGNEYF